MNILIKFFSIFFLTNLYALALDLESLQKTYSIETTSTFILKILIIVAVILAVIIYKQRAIKKLNTELSIKIENEIKKSREKDKMIFEQSKFIWIGEMMENIAHQWRQPLSQINSSVLVIDDILYEKNFKDSVIEEKLLEIESLTKYMSNTINDFKDFFDQNKKQEVFSIQNLIEKSIYIVKGTFKAHYIEVENNIDTKYSFEGCPTELQQVIVVILNNAKDVFISRNIFKPKVQINLDIVSGYYHLSICDNAGGIKAEILEKVFDPYFTTKHESQGTGLGLYLSKRIIEESMHGRILAINQSNGACFKIILKYEG
jgi:C4-dicarboxylate-specific signal transduction histidine kinase